MSRLAHRGTPSGTADRHMGCQGRTGLKALAKGLEGRQAKGVEEVQRGTTTFRASMGSLLAISPV